QLAAWHAERRASFPTPPRPAADGAWGAVSRVQRRSFRQLVSDRSSARMVIPHRSARGGSARYREAVEAYSLLHPRGACGPVARAAVRRLRETADCCVPRDNLIRATDGARVRAPGRA